MKRRIAASRCRSLNADAALSTLALVLLAGAASAAAASGRIVSVSHVGDFSLGVATEVTVTVQNIGFALPPTGGVDDFIVGYESKPFGWLISPAFLNASLAPKRLVVPGEIANRAYETRHASGHAAAD